jgi:hypothetical protein
MWPSLLVVVSLLAGCIVTSVCPYYTAKDLVFEPALLGRWSEAGKTNSTADGWQFEKASTNRYLLTVVDGETNRYHAHLFRLQKKYLFLDLRTTNLLEHTVPIHYLLKVSQIEPTLKLQNLNSKWLEGLLKQHPGTLRHMEYAPDLDKPDDTEIVLTADTKDLQKFVLKYVNDTNAFDTYLDMNPRKE